MASETDAHEQRHSAAARRHDPERSTGRPRGQGDGDRHFGSHGQSVVLDPPLPRDDALVGSVIHFHNDLPLDTSYDIAVLTAKGISTGDITIIQGFVDQKDFAAGYKYLVNPGDRYTVPRTWALDR